jgi:hypothetical protein
MTNQYRLEGLRALRKGKMKDKIITLKVDGAAQGQWSNLLLELNLMKQAWKSYGVDINLKAPGLKSILNHGTKVNDDTKRNRRSS